MAFQYSGIKLKLGDIKLFQELKNKLQLGTMCETVKQMENYLQTSCKCRSKHDFSKT